MTMHSTNYVLMELKPIGEAEQHMTIEEVFGPLLIGVRVVSKHSKLRPDGSLGTVVAWARGTEAHQHWISYHEPPPGEEVTCPYGNECDALCDSEGPLIRWDDQDVGDESLDWFPGQSMSCLDVAGPET